MRPNRTTVPYICIRCGATAQRERHQQRKFCTHSCYIEYYRVPPEVRFWSKVDKNGPVPTHRPNLGPCWAWTGGLMNHGYGLFTVRPYYNQPAHRVMLGWMLGRTLERRELACHRCDNRRCVRPEHLFLSDAQGNSSDAVAKGRMRSGDQHGLRLHPERIARGERAGRAKLTEAQALEILQRARIGSDTQEALAQEFGVTQGCIQLLVTRKTWCHLP